MRSKSVFVGFVFPIVYEKTSEIDVSLYIQDDSQIVTLFDNIHLEKTPAAAMKKKKKKINNMICHYSRLDSPGRRRRGPL